MKKLNQSFHISQLIIRSFQQELDENGKRDLVSWLNTDPRNQALYQDLQQKDLAERKQQIKQLHPEKSWKQLERQIHFKRNNHYLTIFKYVAILLLILSTGLYYYSQRFTTDKPFTLTVTANIPVPGSTKAILILESGEEIELTSGQNFCLQQDTNIQILNTDNILRINISDSISPLKENYSTLSVPKGGEYRIVLSDGSKVWLNSDSRLRFPSPFSGDKRTVFLEEEAYFEVAHDTQKPFVVSTEDMSIRVLGTKFNVKAYAEDEAVYTTLVSGSVRTNNKQSTYSTLLSPNEQCIYYPGNNRMETRKIDPQTFLGWVQGRFIFENETLEEILKQLGRWYDTEIFYQNPRVAKYRFTGNVDRFDQISTLLHMIEKTYPVSFTINGRTIVVK